MPGPGHSHSPASGFGMSDRTKLLFEGTTMMSELYFKLLERHQKLDERLRTLLRRPFVDPLEVARLKKLKLAIKDRLAKRRFTAAQA